MHEGLCFSVEVTFRTNNGPAKCIPVLENGGSLRTLSSGRSGMVEVE